MWDWNKATRVVDQHTTARVMECALTFSHLSDELYKAVGCAGGEDAVWCQFQIKIDLLEQVVHEVNHLNDELILPQVITALEDHL